MSHDENYIRWNNILEGRERVCSCLKSHWIFFLPQRSFYHGK